MRTLIVLYPGFVFHEISVAASILGERHPITITAPHAGNIVDQTGLEFVAKYSYKQLDPNDYKYVLVPGGDVYGIVQNQEIDLFLQNFSVKKNGYIGGICNGSITLGKAGILNKRNYTTTAHPSLADREQFSELLDYAEKIFYNATFIDENVVIDKNFVTAKPWAAIDFAIELGILGGDLDSSKRERLGQYLRGKDPR